MGLFDGMKDAAKKGMDGAKKLQDDRQQKQADKSADQQARGINLQLKSMDGVVSFFDDRIEIKSLLGGKVRDVPYGQIEAVYIDKTSGLAKGAAATMTLGASLAVTNKKTLILSTGSEKFKLDFRRESGASINKARDFVAAKISAKNNPNITVNVQSPTSQGSSSTDEIIQLAELKEKGIITEEEFAAKKKQILGL